ncbi:hypothetical protein HDU76_006712 [Blyttiomyces sp. JEL0837]|nr:hypothetical protein HDU76_006712 [Blyttiomyces sp. JEL0837]
MPGEKAGMQQVNQRDVDAGDEGNEQHELQPFLVGADQQQSSLEPANHSTIDVGGQPDQGSMSSSTTLIDRPLLPSSTTGSKKLPKKKKDRNPFRNISDESIEVTWTGLKICSIVVIAISVLYHLFKPGSEGLFGKPNCEKSMLNGHWNGQPGIEDTTARWATDTCMMAPYTSKELEKCFKGTQIVFTGDSTMRDIYYALRKRLIPAYIEEPDEPRKEDKKIEHGDISLEFYWNPFMNRTDLHKVLKLSRKLSLFMISVGPWYMKYTGGTLGFQDFEEDMNKWGKLLETESNAGRRIATWSVIRYLSPMVDDMLREDRRINMSNRRVKLYNKVIGGLFPGTSETDPDAPFMSNKAATGMIELARDKSLDGLHFAKPVAESEIDIMMQAMCNPVLYKDRMRDKTTCCVKYPVPGWLTVVPVVAALLFGLAVFSIRVYSPDTIKPEVDKYLPDRKLAEAISIFSTILLICFVTDRTHLFGKVNKRFSYFDFFVMNAIWLIPGLLTMRATKDSSFLNRDQTEEWKGWMQFAILVYHYVGASSRVPIYSVIRVMVGSYLFMTGYGHTTYFIKKNDFSLSRISRVLVRLNLLSIALAFIMETDTMFYYFGPLVSIWFMVMYATLAIFPSWNQNHVRVLVKIGISGVLSFLLTHPFNVVPLILGLLYKVLGLSWDAREMTFRIVLDQWAVYAGMVLAVAVDYLQKDGMGGIMKDPKRWSIYKKVILMICAVGVAFLALSEVTGTASGVLVEAIVGKSKVSWHIAVRLLVVLVVLNVWSLAQGNVFKL